ncbi:MAG: hypothetical protein NC483_04255 [Ruminococcus sp.]|nr:hypothetical protein [Ruminococcus sp.]
MKVEEGYLYHIKDEYFDKINNKGLMINHEKGHSRPTYFVIKEQDLLWFIPISSKVDKYKKIISYKMKKYNTCQSILVREIAGEEVAILIQNVFPTLPKYISHIHYKNGKPLKVVDNLKFEILKNFRDLLSMKRNGNNLFFTDIDAIKEMMLEELNEKIGV